MDIGAMADDQKLRVNWKWLFITLAIGAVPVLIFFLFDLWWWGTVCVLLTLFVACFAFTSLYPLMFTLWAMLSIAWLSGAWLEGWLLLRWDVNPNTRTLAAILLGAAAGVLIPAVFWFVALFISTNWIMSVSESFDVSWWQAFWIVATRLFDTGQVYWIVENGQIVVEKPKGVLSKLGGPGVLVVRPGNAVVLERGGKVTRIVGPGTYRLRRFEFIKKPTDIKGIVDLRPQFVKHEKAKVMTRDGIELEITVGEPYQIEPKHITDARPESRYPGGDATTPVLGGPEFPVYEAIIRKAVFGTTPGGWKGLFPFGPINALYDIVGTYTLDQIFPPGLSENPNPDERTLRKIELEVNKRFSAVGAGVWFKGLDISEVVMPADVREQMLKRWTTPMAGQVKIKEAEAERDAMIALSDGRARSLARIEEEKAKARDRMIAVINDLVQVLSNSGRQEIISSFTRVIRELTERVGQDEVVAMRYIEAMQSMVESDGNKSFVVAPPHTAPGALLSPPSADLKAGG